MSTPQMLTATFRAELLKLRKRPALWILTAILLIAVAVFGYLVSYLVLAGGTDMPGIDPDAILASLMPAQVVSTTLNQLAAFGGPIALILAAVTVGSEYAWGTLKTIATQRPGRLVLLAGKYLALAAALAALTVATLSAGWVCSLLIAGLEGEAMTAPPVSEVAGGLAAGWLVLAAYALLGGVLSVVLRSSGLALGLGLVYVLVVENLLLTLPLPEQVRDVIAQLGLGPNAMGLSTAFGEPAADAQMAAVGAPDPTQAAAILAAYTLAFAAVGLLIFRRRPIA